MTELHPRARTPICPACGCAAVFSESPDELLAEISDVVVCPVCLAEKHISQTVEVLHEGSSVRLCRCPGCANMFRNDPDRTLERLAFA